MKNPHGFRWSGVEDDRPWAPVFHTARCQLPPWQGFGDMSASDFETYEHDYSEKTLRIVRHKRDHFAGFRAAKRRLRLTARLLLCA